MNNKGDVEKALEELFGESFDEEKKASENNQDVKEDNNNTVKFEDGNESVVIPVFKDKEELNLINEDNVNIDFSNIDDEKDNQFVNTNNKDEKVSSNTYISIMTKPNNNDKKNINNNNNKNVNSIMIVSIILVICFIVSIAVILFNTNSEQIVSCSYSAKDNGFKITDEYIIAHKSGNLTFIQGEYEYVATSEETKSQIEVIKESKLPVIINSNGMPGFTHTYEISNDFIRIYSYYDITQMDFKKIDKNNDEITPISYINLKSTTTYDNLTKNLKKQGYKCIKSK